MFWYTQFGWTECVWVWVWVGGWVVFICFIASWSEFKSWLSEKKWKPESALSRIQRQKSQHIQQVVDGGQREGNGDMDNGTDIQNHSRKWVIVTVQSSQQQHYVQNCSRQIQQKFDGWTYGDHINIVLPAILRTRWSSLRFAPTIMHNKYYADMHKYTVHYRIQNMYWIQDSMLTCRLYLTIIIHAWD